MNLNQITIPVSDLQASILFYQKLGLLKIVDAPHYARFVCPEGNSTFSLHITKDPILSGVWIYFEAEQLDIRVEELINEGIEFEEKPENKPWLWREARLKDPDGHQLILYYAGKNRIDPPWKII